MFCSKYNNQFYPVKLSDTYDILHLVFLNLD